jgi:hypothetical protein
MTDQPKLEPWWCKVCGTVYQWAPPWCLNPSCVFFDGDAGIRKVGVPDDAMILGVARRVRALLAMSLRARFKAPATLGTFDTWLAEQNDATLLKIARGDE